MIEEFLQYQAVNKGLLPQTIESYRKEAKAFVRYASARGLRWSTITPEDMTEYVSYEVERGMQPRTIKKRVEIVRLIFAWATHNGTLARNPAQYTQVPKIREELPKAANGERLRAYLQQEPTTRESMIVHVVVSLILETGLRIGEVVSLHGEDIDLQNHAIRVTGKGHKERIVYYGKLFTPYAKMVSNRQGKIFEDTEVGVRFRLYRELPGINPHAIRHTFAIEQLNRGMDLKTLGFLLGHKHVTTTEIYAKMTNERTKALYNQINN